jgi:Rad3-related DNA helicase
VATDDVLENIEQLSHEEHELREREGHQQLSDEERSRLRWLEERLDQCWDLLRQRRARSRAGLDPDEASVREVETVEHYRQ